MAILTGEQAYTNVNGIQRPVITTNGCYVQVKWRYQSIDWVPLHMIKELNPIEVAAHDMANDYYYGPYFRLWACIVLKKRDRIVNKLKSILRKNRFKFGVEVPLTVEYTLRIDRENGNTFLHEYIGK